jgi:uncharacterized protein YacL
MVLHVLRALFILLMAAAGFYYIKELTPYWDDAWLAMGTTIILGVILVCVDILAPRKKLAIFSGTFLGLVVGITIAYAFSFVVRLIVEQFVPSDARGEIETVVRCVDILLGICSCYLATSFILQTKDDFRFVIPYVEFSKQTKGTRPILIDTSILIDGRINDIVSTGFLDSRLIVPRFVLDELQLIADSSDKLKRNRGRRGLDVLQRMQDNKRAEVILYDTSGREEGQPLEVDQRLMDLAKELTARVLTIDYNLNKVAQLRGVDVINLNDLAAALKPVVLPGERLAVRLIKPGDESGQAVGFLEDGTMVVVEQGRPHLNEEVEFTVTSVLQSSRGRMIFGRMGGGGGGGESGGPGGGGGKRPRTQQSTAGA